MPTIKVGDCILTKIWKDKRFQVTKKGTGYKEDCFDTDIGERYFLDNRFKSWTKARKKRNEKQS